MVTYESSIKNEMPTAQESGPGWTATSVQSDRDTIVNLLAPTGSHGAAFFTRRHQSDPQEDKHQYSKIPNPPQQAADLLGAFLDHRDLSSVGNFLFKGTMVGLILWLINTVAAYLLAPADSFELLEGIELDANIVVFLILIVTNASRFGPLLMERDEVPIKQSGILFGCLAVQSMTLISVSLMILFPTPVLIEPVTGNRVHLIRWAEWVSLSFMMTFLTEAIDIPLQEAEQAAQDNKEGSEHWVGSSAVRTSWWHAVAISVSTAAGPMYAFATDATAWLIIYTVSLILFSTIYVRLFLRWRRLLKAKKGSTVDSVEAYDRCRLSFRLMLCCCISWTFLGLGLTWGWSLPFIYPPDSVWRKEGIFMAIESFFEGGSKVWYLMVLLHINEAVFDEPMRAVRRLEALRTMMSAVWDNSSDVMVLCLPHSTKSGHIKAIVSPAFSALEDDNYSVSPSTSSNKDTSGRFAFLLEVDVNQNQDFSTTPVHRAFALDLRKPITRFDVRQIQKSLQEQASNLLGKGVSIRTKNLECMAKLIAKATASANDSPGSLVMHDMFGRGPDGREQKVRFEGKITNLETQAVLIVLRDISERFQRFEAEKRLIQEITERRKDAEANRFTRHEVKNGLLAAIAMVESLRDDIGDTTPSPDQKESTSKVAHSKNVSSADNNTESLELSKSCNELYLTLNEILDTILDEAMSRDVVHERYQLHRQRINISQILAPVRRRSSDANKRFPIVLDPEPFPEVIVDPQLLRYIHRNATSNACRYGKPGGVVTTRVSLKDGFLQLEVINLPGDKHEKLVELGDRGASRVFLPRTRLHREIEATTGESNNMTFKMSSSGDGAWIMKKCAKSLGGECSIRFETNETIFTLRCPVVVGGSSLARRNVATPAFALPEGAFGVVIDDSGVQRKLMDRFLDMIGIHKSRRVILGKDAGEILGFSGFLEKIVRDNPRALFLVIVDENLDIVDGVRHQTVSGSLLISQVRSNLSPLDERRMLALVRSANDSAEDVAVYKSRAHGFLCKAPLKKEGVMQTIEPLWKDRFPSQPPPPVAGDKDDDNNFLEDELMYTPTAEELMKTIEAIDALCLVMRSTEAIDALCLSRNNEGALADLWPAVREELHKLKGDLKSLSTGTRMDSILIAFESLKAKKSPEELNERWKTVRSQILSVI